MITREEYNDFWFRNMASKNAIAGVEKQVSNKEIDSKLGDIYKHKILEKLDNEEGYVAFMFNAYEQAENAERFLKAIEEL